MTGSSPRREDPASAVVVPLRVPRARPRGAWFHMADLMYGCVDAVLVMPTDGSGVYLFPLELFSLAADLVSTDPVSLVQAGAGVDVTMFFDASCNARLVQAVAICRARQQGDLSRSAARPRGRRPPGTRAAQRGQVRDRGDPGGEPLTG